VICVRWAFSTQHVLLLAWRNPLCGLISLVFVDRPSRKSHTVGRSVYRQFVGLDRAHPMLRCATPQQPTSPYESVCYEVGEEQNGISLRKAACLRLVPGTRSVPVWWGKDADGGTCELGCMNSCPCMLGWITTTALTGGDEDAHIATRPTGPCRVIRPLGNAAPLRAGGPQQPPVMGAGLHGREASRG
jgi:hypothetical protein